MKTFLIHKLRYMPIVFERSIVTWQNSSWILFIKFPATDFYFWYWSIRNANFAFDTDRILILTICSNGIKVKILLHELKTDKKCPNIKKKVFMKIFVFFRINFGTNSYSMTLSPSYKLLFWLSRVVLWLSLEHIIWNNCKKYQMALRNGVRGFGMWYMDSGWWFEILVDLRSAQFRLYSGKIIEFSKLDNLKYKMTKITSAHRLLERGCIRRRHFWEVRLVNHNLVFDGYFMTVVISTKTHTKIEDWKFKFFQNKVWVVPFQRVLVQSRWERGTS